MTLFPLVTFEIIEHQQADSCLASWGHYLGECERPFGRTSFGLFLGDRLVSVAVSGSTVNGRCAGWARRQVVELTRLCSDPAARWATRIGLRLWRETAAANWPHWKCEALVSYQDAVRHSGNIYRFDGWTKATEVKASSGGGGWSKQRTERNPKAVWVYVLGDHTDEQRRALALERAA